MTPVVIANAQDVQIMRKHSGADLLARLGCVFPAPVFVETVLETHDCAIVCDGRLIMPTRGFKTVGKRDESNNPLHGEAVPTHSGRFSPHKCDRLNRTLAFTVNLGAYNAEDDSECTVSTLMGDSRCSVSSEYYLEDYYVVHVTDTGVVTLMSAIHMNATAEKALFDGDGSGIAQAVKDHSTSIDAIGHVKLWTLQVPLPQYGGGVYSEDARVELERLSKMKFQDHLRERFALFTRFSLPVHTFSYAQWLARKKAEAKERRAEARAEAKADFLNNVAQPNTQTLSMSENVLVSHL